MEKNLGRTTQITHLTYQSQGFRWGPWCNIKNVKNTYGEIIEG